MTSYLERSKFQSQCIETLAIINGKAELLSLHQQRLSYTLKHYFKSSNSIDLCIPLLDYKADQLYKAKYIYNEFTYEVRVTPYESRIINSARIFYIHQFSYPYKTIERRTFDKISHDLEIKQEAILIKNGWVTDGTIYNLVFRKGTQYYTPNTPLLNGVMRQYLLNKNIISETEIKEEDIHNYDECYFINALNPLSKCPRISINQIS